MLSGPADSAHQEVSASVAGYYFVVPSSADSALGIGSVSIANTHIEGRYGYEGPRTASLFLGHRFDVSFVSITPMVGAVFGHQRGVAPGLEFDATLGRFELWSESEYVFDGAHPDASFFYNWSELTFRPVAPFAAGLVLERTRIFRENVAISPGVVAAYTLGMWTIKAYAFESWSADRFFALAVEASP